MQMRRVTLDSRADPKPSADGKPGETTTTKKKRKEKKKKKKLGKNEM